MSRETCTYPISVTLKHKLIKAGYSTEACFAKSSPLSLSKDASITKEEALQVLQLVRKEDEASAIMSCTAHSIAQQEQATLGIVTFSQKIDNMLGDGIPLSKITELCGVPGVGKTQMSLQLCVDATIPESFGGVQGQAIYIDTEGSFVAERVAQISKATIRHCQSVASGLQDPDMAEEAKSYTVERIMKSIHYFRCTSCVELLALINQLPQFILNKCNSNVKVIVVDSFAFHFRHDWDDMTTRTRVMGNLAQQLIRIAVSEQLAVVLVNQMTTKVNAADSKVVPALGESWSHVSTNRMLLLWKNGVRYANLFKSPNRKEDTVPYCVTVEGIRDVDAPAEADEAEEEMPRKWQRIA
ncbi:DNA repair protein RAD51 homolog 3-like [Watersipora subatra]|uniref:DNA repair protein RAD51 homolog 3-like n=1 Tax=Watersipora subatra TaxID=2589382 RepID=UPI00355C64BE